MIITIQWSHDYPRTVGDINPNRVKIESADNRDSLLSNYSIIDYLGAVEIRVADYRDSTVFV
jgi:hypothetical protein